MVKRIQSWVLKGGLRTCALLCRNQGLIPRALHYIINGMGKLTIQMNESPDMEIVYPETEVQDIFTFSNLSYNGTTWTNNDYSEEVPVIITWQKNDGASVPVASRNITFKRNKLTTVNVKVTNSSVDNGIDITTDNEEMQAGDTIVIGASGSEDTGVDVN